MHEDKSLGVYQKWQMISENLAQFSQGLQFIRRCPES